MSDNEDQQNLAAFGHPTAANHTMFEAIATTYSGAAGAYLIEGLKPGNYNITAFFSGKKVSTKSIKIDDDDIEVSFVLVDLEAGLNEITVGASNRSTFGMKRLARASTSTILSAGQL